MYVRGGGCVWCRFLPNKRRPARAAGARSVADNLPAGRPDFGTDESKSSAGGSTTSCCWRTERTEAKKAAGCVVVDEEAPFIMMMERHNLRQRSNTFLLTKSHFN